MEDVMIQYIAKNDEHMKFMETQLSTMKDLLSQRAPKTLPSQIEVNPKNEEFNVVSTSIGKPMVESKKTKKATPTLEKEAITEESHKIEKVGEKRVLAPPQVSVPFP